MSCSFPDLLNVSKYCFCRSTYQVRSFWNKKQDSGECVQNVEQESNPCEDTSSKIPASWSQPKVVIVGAGIAGLSAAHRLVQSGIHDIKILEATDRPGGRIHSCWFNNCIAELGATKIKGACVANSVYNLAVMEGLLKSPVARHSPSKSQYFTSRGKHIDVVLSKKASAVFRHIEQKAMTIFESDGCLEEPNLEIFMSTHIREELMNFPESERQGALMVMNACLASLKEKTGANLESVDTKFYGSLPSLPGGDIKVPVGFVGVLAHLIRDIPDGCIRYCKTVEGIRWDANEADKPRACVQCSDEDVFPADYVIVTTPLGVLKNKAEHLFTPNLPAKKMVAIKTLGFGHMNNIFLWFSEPLWLKDNGDLVFAWHPDDYAKLNSWVTGLTSLRVDDNSGQVISGAVAGKEAAVLEMMDPDQIKSDVQKVLQCFLGSPSIPKPSSVLRSKWTSDAFTKGAFTYISTDAGLDRIKDLANPVPDPHGCVIPVLFFAGEHTCQNNYATVHGARDSGIREADRIISHTRDLKGAPSKQTTK